jgi:hypothetical protein
MTESPGMKAQRNSHDQSRNEHAQNAALHRRQSDPGSDQLPHAAAWQAMTGALTGNYDAPSIV